MGGGVGRDADGCGGVIVPMVHMVVVELVGDADGLVAGDAGVVVMLEDGGSGGGCGGGGGDIGCYG